MNAIFLVLQKNNSLQKLCYEILNFLDYYYNYFKKHYKTIFKCLNCLLQTKVKFHRAVLLSHIVSYEIRWQSRLALSTWLHFKRVNLNECFFIILNRTFLFLRIYYSLKWLTTRQSLMWCQKQGNSNWSYQQPQVLFIKNCWNFTQQHCKSTKWGSWSETLKNS